MSSEHSPAGSDASQESSEGNMSYTSNMAPEGFHVRQSSDENIADTGPDGQSVPANEAVIESNPMLMRETMSSMLELLIH